MGRLIDMFRLTCEFCRKQSIPLSISGKYLTGETAVLQACSLCNYVRFHGELGAIGVHKRVRKSISSKANGRLSQYLREMAEKSTYPSLRTKNQSR